jgi:CheY-like chemotaxis protein/HPt (histidine-containing phosphotransfer) domain-containing protein
MQMPDMDGESLGRTIKNDPDLRDTLLVMMSSLGNRGDAKRLESFGFSAYLTKPVRQSQLYDCLATVVGRAVAVAPSSRSTLITRHTLNEARRRSVRILLAEDNPTNQEVALRVLEKLGYFADAVANGQEALASLEKIPYDIVLMDVQMPVMDGFEATRRIRDPQSKVGNHRVPIIAMTAHAMKGDRERCVEAGMDDYVSKPISPQALAQAVERWLAPDRNRPASPSAPGAEVLPLEKELVFDRPALLARLMGDEDLVREIVAGFLEDMPNQIGALQKHVGAGDAAGAGLKAHTIKGAAANVGAMALSVVALQMEKAGRSGRLEGLVALVPELERQFDLLRTRLGEEAP